MKRISSTGISASVTPSDADSSSFSRVDAVLCGALVPAVLAMFWKVLFGGRMFFYRDILNQSYPEERFVRRMLRRGALPMWNRYLNFGQPHLANPNSLVSYPTTLLIALLPFNLAYALHFVLHFTGMALGAYLLARQWGQSRTAALFAGAVFVLSGPVLSLGSFYNQVAAAAWIPWALLATDRALHGSSSRRWVLLAVVFALQFLAGEPFTFVATFMLCFIYALRYSASWKKLWSPSNRIVVTAFVAAGALALGLAAVQLIPGLVLLKNSLRGAVGMPYSQTTYWSLSPLSLLDMLMPAFFGPIFSTPSLWTTLLNFANRPYFPSLFIGFVPLFLAGVAWRGRTDRRRDFAGWAALILLLLSFGRFTPVFALAYAFFPPLQLVRFPIKVLVPFALLVAILAGWGIDDLREGGEAMGERARKLLPLAKLLLGLVAITWAASWIAPAAVMTLAEGLLQWTSRVVGAPGYLHLPPETLRNAAIYLVIITRLRFPELLAFACGALLWLVALERRHRWAKKALPLAALMALAELAAANYGVNPTVPKRFFTYRPPVMDNFKPSRMPYRYAILFGSSPLATVTADQAQSLLDFRQIPAAQKLSSLAQSEFQERLLLEHGGMLEGLESTSNVDVDLSFPPQLFDFWVYAAQEAHDPAKEACLLGRANVRYQIVGQQLNLPTLRQITTVFNGSPDPSYLYENRCFLPRAYVAGEARSAPNPADVLSALSSPDFDAAHVVLLDRQSDLIPSWPQSAASAGQVNAFQRAPNEVRLSVTLARPAYVVLLDRYARGWRATLDGRPVPIRRANLLFRAVRAGPGRHEIRFVYRTPGLRLGLAITLVALVIALALLVLDPKVPSFDPKEPA
jgi:hypothetical protein